jgi:hypothetical protein
MGGFGSGKWSNILTRKVSVERCRVLSIKKLRLAGLFNGVGSAQSVVFNDGALEYEIALERTACRLGGFRYWFVCPVVKDEIYCGNRVGKLYLPPGGKFFGCRQCYDLTYESCQRSHKYDRVLDHIPDGLDLSGLNVNQLLRLASL